MRLACLIFCLLAYNITIGVTEVLKHGGLGLPTEFSRLSSLHRLQDFMLTHIINNNQKSFKFYRQKTIQTKV